MLIEYDQDLNIEGFAGLKLQRCTVRVYPKWKRGMFSPLPLVRTLILQFDLPDGAQLSPEDVFVSLRESIRSNRVRIEGQTPKSIRIDTAELWFESDERLRSADIRVAVELAEPLPFPFVPGLIAAPLPDDPPFEKAFYAAYSLDHFPVVVAETVETDRYWLFPIRSIGSTGVIVDRRTAIATGMGSAYDREVWVWAWEQNLMTTSEDEPIVIEECLDPKTVCERLAHPYAVTLSQLEQTPVTLPNDWRGYDGLYACRELIRLRRR